MTDEDIELEYYIDQEYERLRDEAEKSIIPYCPECNYRGNPVAEQICPRCGAEMTIPASDQTTYQDDDPIASMESMGMPLTENDKALFKEMNK